MAEILRVVIPAGVQEGADYVRRALPTAEIRIVDPADEAAWLDALRDADALVSSFLRPEQTSGARNLRLIQTVGAGANGVDPAAVPVGCTLASTHGHATVVAESAVMGMLAVAKRLIEKDRALRRGEWIGFDTIGVRDLRHRRLGLVGYGSIGRSVGRLAQAFGMTLAAVTRSPDPTRAAGLEWLGGYDELARLMRESDHVVVSAALTPETTGLIGAAELALLGPQSYLVNVGRGELVDERALYQALRERTIAGAAIDVWYRYPAARRPGAPPDAGPVMPSEYPFHELDNVVMTPHTAGMSEGSKPAQWIEIAEQLVRLAREQPLEHVEGVGPLP